MRYNKNRQDKLERVYYFLVKDLYIYVTRVEGELAVTLLRKHAFKGTINCLKGRFRYVFLVYADRITYNIILIFNIFLESPKQSNKQFLKEGSHFLNFFLLSHWIW